MGVGEEHRPAAHGDREVTRLAFTQHAHAYLRVGLDVAHDVDHLPGGFRAGQRGAVERHDDVAGANAGLRSRTTRTHLAHLRTGCAARGVQLHTEDGAT